MLSDWSIGIFPDWPLGGARLPVVVIDSLSRRGLAIERFAAPAAFARACVADETRRPTFQRLKVCRGFRRPLADRWQLDLQAWPVYPTGALR
jgi:hypothetical protein